MGEFDQHEGEAQTIVNLAEAAMHMYRAAIDSLPFPEDKKFQKRAEVVLTGMRKLRAALTEAVAALEVALAGFTRTANLETLLPPSVSLVVRGDRAQTIREAFRDIQVTMIITLVLVVAVIYVFLIVAFRFAGKRELGQSNTLDLAVLLLVANAVQNGIIGNDTASPVG